MMTMTATTLKQLRSSAFSMIFVVVMAAAAQQENNERLPLFLNRFTYDDATTIRDDGFGDYSPQDWDKISCPPSKFGVDDCLAYHDKWHEGRDWDLASNNVDDDWVIQNSKGSLWSDNSNGNSCKHCPESGSSDCGRHHQSPIDLKREYGLEIGTHQNARECIDLHWMKYEDSFCTMDQLEDANAFTIERHALRISQPIEVYDNISEDKDGVPDGVRSMCRIEGKGSRFGRIDYSKGFSDWWYLSHMDIHVPSEHTQEGIQYDAEIQLQHFYSIPYWNEMGTVSVFMNAYENAPVYRYLDKIICQWRRHEYEIRNECGLEPIESPYPGCFPLKRDRERNRNLNVRRRRTSSTTKEESNSQDKWFQNVADVLSYNERHKNDPNHRHVRVDLNDNDKEEADEDKDWESWIKEESKKMNDEDEFYHTLKERDHGGNHTEELHQQFRDLLEGDEIEWFNYWPMLGVRTEYYYRYEGTQTIPPCHGKWIEESRRNTNHWRVMKDPIRIHPRQLGELQRLMADRIAPSDDPVVPCQADTAAKVRRDPNDPRQILEVTAARPVQSTTKAHYETFCECKDWGSKWKEDQDWCRIEDINERFYDKPYNFMTNGF